MRVNDAEQAANGRFRETINTSYGPTDIWRIDGLSGSEYLGFSQRVILENLVRHLDGEVVTEHDIEAVLRGENGEHDIAFHPSRVFLHDTNGVPVLTDLAALRDAVVAAGSPASAIDIDVPSHLTVDHSVVTDFFARADAPALNVRREYERNAERYRFLKWGQQAFSGLKVIPPGAGIMHQINVEYLSQVIHFENGRAFPDTVAGTDSHTTMVNGMALLAWGVGGIEAEAAMLGLPITMLLPPVTGARLIGELPAGVTATDLVLTLTERMRALGVVGNIVEFHGPAVAAMSVPTRCTISNMCPEFGATSAMFPIDECTTDFLADSGRSAQHVEFVEQYAKEQGLWHDPNRAVRFDREVTVDLGEITTSLAGPRRPQDRIELGDVARVAGDFLEARTSTAPKTETTLPEAAPATVAESVTEVAPATEASPPATEAGPPVSAPESETGTDPADRGVRDGDVAIASITSCTNTSNPLVMVAAGLLARNARDRGLRPKPWVKTSLAPGSRVVTDYLEKAGLLNALSDVGFGLVGYGCMTCIGNSGELLPEVAQAVREDGRIVASVLSGNRNFDGRINNDVGMNFLASPPLVVAYAFAGTIHLDLTTEPLGVSADGEDVFLADLWPNDDEIDSVVRDSVDPEIYHEVYETIFDGDENWQSLDVSGGERFDWEEESTYIRRPPFLDAPDRGISDITGARALMVLEDSVTTDHICPAGRIPSVTPAGQLLLDRGVEARNLNSFASRRGNWEVMRLGGFTNKHLINRLVPRGNGGYTRSLAEEAERGSLGTAESDAAIIRPIHEVAEAAAARDVPLVVLGGKEYGTGSSRDWAAKVTSILGVRAVVAESFERIHRSNLVGMGVLPLQFAAGDSIDSLGLDGTEVFTISGLDADGSVAESATVTAVHPATGRTAEFTVLTRVDTALEQRYFRAGGILPYALEVSLSETDSAGDELEPETQLGERQHKEATQCDETTQHDGTRREAAQYEGTISA
jgi:aconitate hydratase